MGFASAIRFIGRHMSKTDTVCPLYRTGNEVGAAFHNGLTLEEYRARMMELHRQREFILKISTQQSTTQAQGAS